MTVTLFAERALHIPSLAGELPRGWTWRRLDEVCDDIIDCPHSTPVLTDTGPYVVRTQDILTRRFRADLAAHVSEGTYQDRIRRGEPRFGDLLFSREGTYFGIAAEVPRGTRVCLGQRMVLLRPTSATTDTRFLKYWLNSPLLASHVEGLRDGTVAERLNMPTIRALPVPIAPLKQQERIGQILGSLDEKIDLNRQTNESLEGMGRALFKSWFIDFDPVHSKAAVRREHKKWTNAQVSHAALPNFTSNIAELFPDHFDDSPDGPIPAGWNVGTNADLFDINKITIKPNEYPTEVFYHYSIPAYDQGSRPTVECGDQIMSNKFLVSSDCVLLTKLNPRIRRVWLPFPNGNCRSICSTEFLVLKPRTSIAREFIYSHVSSDPFFEVYQTMVTGTSGSHQRIKPEYLVGMQSVLPPLHIVQAYGKIAAGLFEQSESLRVQSCELARTRDSLLPRLLSGELSLSEYRP